MVKALCTPCHRRTPEWLAEQVTAFQDSVWLLRRRPGLTIASVHEAIMKEGEKEEANKQSLRETRDLIRKSQWHWDMAASEKSMGFHNPTLVLTTLGQSIDLAHQAIAASQQAGD